MSVETVFSSRGRVKILKILVEIGELNISEIARRARLNYTTTNQHLRVLEESGIVHHKNFGRIRIFMFNDDDPRAMMIKDLISEWDK
jgi:DNA-binding transcriptional ArsR family regulator